MAILEHEVRSGRFHSITLQRHLFTRDEYHALSDILRDRHVELLEGEIIEMAPIGPSHAAITQPLTDLIAKAFGPGFSVRSQTPVALGDERNASEPEPDVAVVAGSWRDYLSRQPGPADIKLIVEIADSSLSYDRTIKAALYATAGIPEYWIVNLLERQLEVYREPGEAGYAAVSNYLAGGSVEPLFAPGSNVVVTDFMP